MRRFFLSFLTLVSTAIAGDVNYSFVNDQQLPLVITSDLALPDFQDWLVAHQNELKSFLAQYGALLFRDFPIRGSEDFASVIDALLGSKIDYIGEGSRTKVSKGVYTSTEAPAKFHIPLHHELTCTDNPVSYISFFCEVAPKSGTGQTLLGSTERVTRAVMERPDVWNLFKDKVIKYISRHPPEGSFFARVNVTHRTWQKAFETDSREEVERICCEKGFQFRWLDNWIEVTRLAPAIRGPDEYYDHPYWYNQAHLYDANPRIRGGWLNHILANALYINPTTRQYDVEFADGTKIPRDIVYQIYDVLEKETVRFDWKEGDVLVIDNRRTLHGRAPYKGKRRILTIMTHN